MATVLLDGAQHTSRVQRDALRRAGRPEQPGEPGREPPIAGAISQVWALMHPIGGHSAS